MSKYQPVLGLEIHVELNTKSKMFCGCSADYYGKSPNTHTCPVCLGLPGALPSINKEAIKKCIQIGLALNCKINENSKFERKNYFYPDLAKGYQISQYRWPLCTEGYFEIESEEGVKKIRINRVHQEEDTGKLVHMGTNSGVDFNRAGVPLVEIVTEPDFSSSLEVREFAKKLQQIFKDLEVSSADMEKGDMRLEANVSVRVISPSTGSGSKDHQPSDTRQELPNYRVELKNINSFKFMADAIEYEFQRQSEALEKGEILTQETRGWNEDKKQTVLQRRKEEANDYRYFPDPDLPELRLKDLGVVVDDLRESMPKLRLVRINELMEVYNLTKASATTIVNKGTADLFESVIKWGEDKGLEAKGVANFIANRDLGNYKNDPIAIGTAIIALKSGLIDDLDQINKWIQEAVDENPGIVEAYRGGKVNVANVLIGVVMRKASGKADIDKVKELLEKALS